MTKQEIINYLMKNLRSYEEKQNIYANEKSCYRDMRLGRKSDEELEELMEKMRFLINEYYRILIDIGVEPKSLIIENLIHTLTVEEKFKKDKK